MLRPWDGIGDWLFCLAVLKLVNRQRPDVECFVDFSAKRARAGLPPLVRQLYEESDVKYTPGVGPPGGMATRDSLVYRKYPPVLYLESVVHHLNDQTGLGIAYEHGIYPTFRTARPAHARANYVVMISQGKRRDRYGKEWGFLNFAALARELTRRGVDVVQVGRGGDPRLHVTRHELGQSAARVVSLLSGARAFIGVENGLMVLAGYLGVPQVTIYDGASNPSRVDFANHAKLEKRIEPRPAAECIHHWLETGTL